MSIFTFHTSIQGSKVSMSTSRDASREHRVVMRVAEFEWPSEAGLPGTGKALQVLAMTGRSSAVAAERVGSRAR